MDKNRQLFLLQTLNCDVNLTKEKNTLFLDSSHLKETAWLNPKILSRIKFENLANRLEKDLNFPMLSGLTMITPINPKYYPDYLYPYIISNTNPWIAYHYSITIVV